MRQSGSQTYTGSFCLCPTVWLVTCAECRHSEISLHSSPNFSKEFPWPSVRLCPTAAGNSCKISLWSIMSSNQQHLQGQDGHRCFPVAPHPSCVRARVRSPAGTPQSWQPVLQMGEDMYLCLCGSPVVGTAFTARLNIRRLFGSKIDCF